jgi:tetratricopeptide (TPR) repeat protein
LDREEQLVVLSGHIENLREDPGHFKVVQVLGLGGMGKTSLLEEVWLEVDRSSGPHQLIWVSLEGEASTGSAGPLLAMRDQLDCDCLLFDTALLAYWNAMGQPLQLARSTRLAGSLVVKALEIGGTFAGFVLPIGFAMNTFHALKHTVIKRLHYEPEEFQEVERLRTRPVELLERLPYYLAVDLERSTRAASGWFLAFYDAYDRQKDATREAGAPWLQQFIATLERGVHIVSTREPLGWSATIWAETLVEVSVGALPEDDARGMVSSRLGALPAALEDRLIVATRRIPFLLDTVITSYVALVREGHEISAEDLPSSPDAAVTHLLTHLPEPERELAIALATTQIFDEELFRSIVRGLNIQVSFTGFQSFVDWYFVEPVVAGLFKTHDLLTAFVREASSAAPVRLAALEEATKDLLERTLRTEPLNPDKILPILRAVIAGWYSTEQVPTRSIEILVDVGFLLYDAGYWNELASLGSEGTPGHDHPVELLLEFFVTLTARRIFGVAAALDRFASLMPRADPLGRHQVAVELEGAYVKGLSGDYPQARKDFRRLARGSERWDPGDRTQVRARMYYGGMLLMDGAFRESSRLLLETYEAVDRDANPDWGELVRYRGHAHRLSFALDQAEELYLRAMHATRAGRAPALLGRLHTNLAETYCWTEPLRALEAADYAAKIHKALGNRIELAKCDAARGIALSALGDCEQAREVIDRSLLRAEEVGYRAGVAFALQAKVVAEWRAGEGEASAASCRELWTLVESMGTYLHLQVAPLFLVGHDAEVARLVSQIEWISAPGSLETRLGAYLESR